MSRVRRRPHNWLGSPSTALPAMIAVAVWKEAGFFMIFYLAALQTHAADLREAAALEGSSRWNFFRRVTLPLLMPTTLFVLVNAVINAFRVVDHIVVMTAAGRTTPRRCCSTMSTRPASASGTPPRGDADVVLLPILGARRLAQFGVLGAGCITDDGR